MYILKLLLFLCSLHNAMSQLYSYWYYRTWNQRARFKDLMKIYIDQEDIRVKESFQMRFMYEESPQYEIGYLMSEILEKYRKMIEIVYPLTKQTEIFHSRLKRVEQIQTLYFEVYHLVNMMHEIPAKYASVVEYSDIRMDGSSVAPEDEGPRVNLEELLKRQQAYIEYMEAEERKRKRHAKKMKKLHDIMANSTLGKGPHVITGPPNKAWPLDYGWEIHPLAIPYPFTDLPDRKPFKGG